MIETQSDQTGKCTEAKRQKSEPRKNSNKMGYFGCSSYVVGNIIGSGIFITPGSVISYAQSIGLSLAIWIACGLISMLGLKYSLAFAFMWVSVLLTHPASIAVQAQTFGKYIVEGISPLFPLDEPFHYVAELALGLLLLCFMVWLNFHSLKSFASRFQIVATAAKLVSMALIICGGVYVYLFGEASEDLKSPMANSNWGPKGIVLGLYSGLWSYSGWEILNYGAPEISNPRRNLPVALISGIAIVTFIYTSINFAYFVVLGVETVRTSDAIAATFSDKVFGHFSFLIPFMIAILICGTLNSNVFCASRCMYAAARERHLPSFLSCINEDTGSPRVAITFQALLATAFMFIDINTLIEYTTFIMFFQKVVTVLALLWIRCKRKPVEKDAIRVPIPLTILFLIVSIVLVVVPVVLDFSVTFIGLLIFIVGIVFYYTFVWSTHPYPILQKVNDALTKICIRIFNCKTDIRENKSMKAKKSKNEHDIGISISLTEFERSTTEMLHSPEEAGPCDETLALHIAVTTDR